MTRCCEQYTQYHNSYNQLQYQYSHFNISRVLATKKYIPSGFDTRCAENAQMQFTASVSELNRMATALHNWLYILCGTNYMYLIKWNQYHKSEFQGDWSFLGLTRPQSFNFSRTFQDPLQTRDLIHPTRHQYKLAQVNAHMKQYSNLPASVSCTQNPYF